MLKKNLIAAVDAHVNAGRMAAAVSLCSRVLALTPDHPEALYLLGTVHTMSRNNEAGLKPLRRLIELEPLHRPGLINLGNCYLHTGRLSEAAECFKKVLFQDPSNGMALNNLGVICARKKSHTEALQYYERALILLPDDPEILSNLIVSYNAVGKVEEALCLARKVITMVCPGEALFPAFNLLKVACCWEEADLVLPKLIQKIDRAEVTPEGFLHINLALLTLPSLNHRMLFDLFKKGGEAIESRREHPKFHYNQPERPADGKWRVAYLSPDFRNHVVNDFFRGLLNHHDREHFKVYCYSNTQVEDAVTAQYKKCADVFVDITRMSDRQTMEKIHADGIHFLIDLAGFTEGGRLSILSGCPAPVQLMYLGFPYTSGLNTVDYVISDPYLDGPENAAYFTETPLNLPESFISYEGLGGRNTLGMVPSIQNGYIAFGSLVNPYKLNPHVIQVWSQILKHKPESKLILNHPRYELKTIRGNIVTAFLKQGVLPDRIQFCWTSHPSGNFLQHYNEIDIVLDPFPATGGVTTCDAVCMGKAVITLVGEITPERLSYSILKNVGLDLGDLIAFDTKDYVEKALALANNEERIFELLSAIPLSLKNSILCDPLRFARQVEAAYLEAWQRKFKDVPIRHNNAHLVSNFRGC